ncbi:MAG TPA: hypothetical protein VNL77_08495 [Roseiflexaceae bacterium]|nr:hypothetical protein [Roseiflexaceae bacterium]
MTSESQSAPSAPPPPAPAPARRGGFFGRLFAALLVVLITTFLALVAGAAGLLYLGYTVRTPTEAAEAQRRVATVEAAQAGMETRVAELERRFGDQAETLGELRAEVEALADVRADLEQQLETGARQNATMVAEARMSRDEVLSFATAEAGRAALLQELERRSARVERFLQRLSDIAEDAALDLGATAPAVLTATPPPTPTGIPPTPPPTPTETLVPSETLAPAETPTPAETPALTATPTPATTRTPTATP